MLAGQMQWAVRWLDQPPILHNALKALLNLRWVFSHAPNIHQSLSFDTKPDIDICAGWKTNKRWTCLKKNLKIKVLTKPMLVTLLRMNAQPFQNLKIVLFAQKNILKWKTFDCNRHVPLCALYIDIVSIHKCEVAGYHLPQWTPFPALPFRFFTFSPFSQPGWFPYKQMCMEYLTPPLPFLPLHMPLFTLKEQVWYKESSQRTDYSKTLPQNLKLLYTSHCHIPLGVW